jgi:protein O-mannosyl-transferase
MYRLFERRWLAPCVLIAAVILTYAPVTGFGFVDWDDPQIVIGNPMVRSFSPEVFWSYDPELYAPLTYLTYQTEFALVGANAAVFHTVNLLLHICVTLLAFGLIRRLTGKAALAFIAALLFAVHPVNAEAVSWISARKELLSAAFGLAFLLSYANKRPQWQTVALFVLALLSKVNVILLPLLLPLIDGWRGEALTKESLKSHWPYAALMLLFAVIAVGGKSGTLASLSPMGIVLLAGQSLVFALQKLFMPVGLSAIYPAPANAVQLMPGAMWFSLAAVLMAGLFMLFRRDRAVLFGISLFLLSLAPSFLAYQKSNDVTLGADRYMYLPSIGICMALVVLAYRVAKRESAERIVLSLGIIVACILGTLAHTQAKTWRNTDALFSNVLSVYPDSHVAKSNLGFARMNEGKTDEAITLFADAIKLKPTYADAHVNLAAAYGRQGKLVEAESEAMTAIDIEINNTQAHVVLAGTYFTAGYLPEARSEYERALSIQPYHLQARYLLAQVLLKLNEKQAAEDMYRSLVRDDPSYAGQSAALDSLLQ